MRLSEIVLLLILMAIAGNSFTQNSDNVQTLSVDSQFIDLVENSNSYKQYKVIERSKIEDLKANVLDTLHKLRGKIAGSENKIEEQQAKIDQLNSSVETLQSESEQLTAEKNSVLFLGALIEKDLFKTIFWVVIIVLVLALVLFIYKYYNSQKVTVESRHELMEAHKELEEQRRKHIKKEQKIMRELQDEINKNNK